ncbi:hypothetical protein [Planctobacterium marinum]|uniref:DUF1579 domain-containing protein n=1 Tax=Planctobacterium marinum TaxID=1631968 RepID=A0AA48HVE3_9ALTE|nr:hypothetical protein MACH26_42050 [Planctobacterium marinum]
MKALLCLFLLSTLSLTACAQNSPPDCQSEPHRQFDFWVGDWVVSDKDGNLQGHNTIELLLNDCTLQENWRGAKGSSGKSFNLYDRQTKQWHQTWIDANGGILYLDGTLQNEVMVLEGERLGRDGKPVTHRISYTPLEDGQVKQHWQVSRDSGKTWQDAFLGFYKRKSSTTAM